MDRASHSTVLKSFNQQKALPENSNYIRVPTLITLFLLKNKM